MSDKRTTFENLTFFLVMALVVVWWTYRPFVTLGKRKKKVGNKATFCGDKGIWTCELWRWKLKDLPDLSKERTDNLAHLLRTFTVQTEIVGTVLLGSLLNNEQ